MTIQEILGRHIADVCNHGDIECRCGEQCDTPEAHRAHLAEVLDKHMREAKAEAYKDAERILHEEARWQLDLHQRHKEYRFKHCSERMTEMENCMTVRANQ